MEMNLGILYIVLFFQQQELLKYRYSISNTLCMNAVKLLESDQQVLHRLPYLFQQSKF